MESDGENEELFSDEERELELTVLRVVKCTAHNGMIILRSIPWK